MVKVYKLEQDVIFQEIDVGTRWAPKYNGVRLIHLPTKTVIESVDETSAHLNRIKCEEELQKILEAASCGELPEHRLI